MDVELLGPAVVYCHAKMSSLDAVVTVSVVGFSPAIACIRSFLAEIKSTLLVTDIP